jgi:hypothetical protein
MALKVLCHRSLHFYEVLDNWWSLQGRQHRKWRHDKTSNDKTPKDKMFVAQCDVKGIFSTMMFISFL